MKLVKVEQRQAERGNAPSFVDEGRRFRLEAVLVRRFVALFDELADERFVKTFDTL